ncbi:hypothetical protein ACR91X_24815 [Klebsiella pneumoniae]
MIIEGKIVNDLSTKNVDKFQLLMNINQEGDAIIIDKQQAAQLIEVLQRWVDGEEIE